MRVGPHGGISQSTYDGYLQVELKGKGKKTLWPEHINAPSGFPCNDIVWELSNHFVKNLMAPPRQKKNAETELASRF